MGRCSRTFAVVTAALVVLVPARPAQAYLDPGTGSLILQAVAGTLLGCLVAVKVFWRQIRGFCAKRLGRKGGQGGPPPEAGEGGPETRDDG